MAATQTGDMDEELEEYVSALRATGTNDGVFMERAPTGKPAMLMEL